MTFLYMSNASDSKINETSACLVLEKEINCLDVSGNVLEMPRHANVRDCFWNRVRNHREFRGTMSRVCRILWSCHIEQLQVLVMSSAAHVKLLPGDLPAAHLQDVADTNEKRTTIRDHLAAWHFQPANSRCATNCFPAPIVVSRKPGSTIARRSSRAGNPHDNSSCAVT